MDCNSPGYVWITTQTIARLVSRNNSDTKIRGGSRRPPGTDDQSCETAHFGSYAPHGVNAPIWTAFSFAEWDVLECILGSFRALLVVFCVVFVLFLGWFCCFGPQGHVDFPRLVRG